LRRVPVDLLRPGMKVARAVYGTHGQLLLNAGVVLNAAYIRRLKALGVPALYIDEGWAPDIQVEDVISDATRLKAVEQVRKLLAEQAAEKPVVAKTMILTREIAATINEIIDELLNHQSLMVNLTDIRTLDTYTFAHSVNVCVLALLAGIGLGYDRAKLFHLGMGAILHDIGKIRIPASILNKPGPLTEEEWAAIKRHPEYGWEILQKNPEVSHLSALVAWQHHERYHGGGYPRGLRGEEINELAQIAGVADMYDALTADRPYRSAYPPHEAYEMIAGGGDFLFSFRVVRAFLHHIAVYPAGTIVALNTGEIAVVLETLKGYSLYPRVRVLYDAERRPVVPPFEILLAEERTRVVTRVLSPEEVEQLPRTTGATEV